MDTQCYCTGERMTPKQIAKREYNERDYTIHGNARRAYGREYYWRNREKVLAYKKGHYAVNGDKCRARTDRYRNSEQGKMKRIEHTLRQMAQ